MAHRHDGIGPGDRLIGEAQGAEVCSRSVPARQVEHGGRGVGGDHPVSGLDEVAGEQTTSAPDLDHEAVTFTNRGQEVDDGRRTGVGVESEPEVMDQGEIGAVIGIVCRGRVHVQVCPGGVAQSTGQCLERPSNATISATCFLSRSRPMSSNDEGR